MSVPRPLLATGWAMRREICRLRTPSHRPFHSRSPSSAAQPAPAQQPEQTPASLTNSPLSFPCLDQTEQRTRTLLSTPRRSHSGPEPSYTTGQHLTFHSPAPFLLDWGGILPSFSLAYETWGALDADRGNAILLHTGLSASSHARSTARNAAPGWWERFIGPGAPLDTDRYFVVCTNVLGGCYGSTGPGSVQGGGAGGRWATRFPILTMQDMVRAQFRLLDELGIGRLYASVGSSMGGMQSLAAGVLEPERVGRVVSVSGCARSHPYSIAMRHTQRQVLMNDPAWASTRGDYYDGVPPHAGMKLAREIATVTYRSGPEWEQRFGRRRADPTKPPALCPDFLIETYLDHAGEKWCLEYDANSLLYVSKAMDLFDLGAEHMGVLDKSRRDNHWKLERLGGAGADRVEDRKDLCNLTLPDTPYEEQDEGGGADAAAADDGAAAAKRPVTTAGPPEDLVRGLAPMKDTPTLVMGVASDILFPAWQQREIAETLRRAGNRSVTHVELGEDRSLFGHDTFLLDLEGVGGEIKRFLG